MTEKIKIPDSVNDMNLSHFPFYLELVEMVGDNKEINPNFIHNLEAVQVSDLNALFFGTGNGSFDIYDDKSNRTILSEILISSSKYEVEKVRPEIEVSDKVYVLNLDFTKQNVAFHRDLSKLDLKERPEDMLAMAYLEKDMVYNQVDKSKMVINPRSERSENLKSAFTLAQFLDLQAFFLESWEGLKPFSSKKQKEIVRRRNGTGKSQSTT